MKEIRKEKAKKFVITFSVLVSVFLLITLIGYVIEVKLIGDSIYSYIDYLVYLLGYGSLDNVNVWFRLFFSVGSLLALTLFSSACTVTWLESRRVLKLDNHIAISKNDEGDFVAKLRLSSTKRDIYGAKVSLVVNINGKSFSEETELAYIPKNQCSDAVFTVGLNSVIYRHFSEFDRNPSNVSELVATVTYSDMLSGTEFTMFEKFACKNPSDFVFERAANDEDTQENIIRKTFFDFIGQSKFDVDFSLAQILDSKLPDRTPYTDNQCFNVNFASSVDYNEYDFQMLYVPVPEVTEWGAYHDMKCNFYIKLSITEGTTVEVQIKKNDGSILNLGANNRLTGENSSLILKLSEYKRITWENIKELCFTVFYKNMKNPEKRAKIIVEECTFVLPEAKQACNCSQKQ